MSQENRVETMAHKLAVYAGRAGIRDAGLITDAFYLAVQPRLRQLKDVFHFDVLHPARTALILLDQTDCRDSTVLAAAQLTESFDDTLRPALEEIAALGREVFEVVQAVPLPAGDDEALLEALLVAPRDVARIALAERLDHARHLHMRSRALWRPYYEQTVHIYLPLAQRLDEALFYRFDRWRQAFQRRLA